MPSLPSGTVTFVFTDIQGSTDLLRELGAERYAVVLSEHRSQLSDAIVRHGGVSIGATGDAFFSVFPRATQALTAAREGQLALASSGVRIRVGVHTGEPIVVGGEYVGMDVHKAARIAAVGHGGQILLSEQTAVLAADAELIDLGVHRLKDLSHPVRIYQLGGLGLQEEFPPLRSLDQRRHNLPFQATPLIGREAEVKELADRLTSRQQLVTLTGPGGTGKTRLAVQVAAEVLDEFDGGVHFVNLASVDDPSRVAAVTIQALGLKEAVGQDELETLRQYLQNRPTLLLFDNFEQVIEGAPLIGELMAAVPALRVLVTSRVPLRLRGEHEFPVSTLGSPDRPDQVSIEALLRYPAVRLFVERSQAVRPDFRLTQENASAVADICRRLDGLPLAIELAAARSRILHPAAMLDRLGNRLRLLSGGARDLPARHQTLRNAIDWSHDLLAPVEKQLFRRLAIFAGPATLTAIEKVCYHDDLGDDALDTTASLVEKSLLRAEAPIGSDPSFGMLEIIREFGHEELETSGEYATTAERHARYFAGLAEEARPHLVRNEQRRWLDQLESQHDDLRAALRWAFSGGDPKVGIRIAAALQVFWVAHGHFREGRGWIEAALDFADEASSQARAELLFGLTAITHRQGALEEAEQALREALRITRESGDRRAIAMALLNLGAILGERGELTEARGILEESLTILEELGDQRLMGMVLTNLGAITETMGDTSRAGELYRAAVDRYEAVGDQAGSATALSNLGHIALAGDDLAEAEALFRKSLYMAQDAGFTYDPIYEILNLALVAVRRGEAERAAQLFGFAHKQLEIAGAKPSNLDKARYDSALVACRDLIDPSRWTELWQRGSAMSFDDAIAYALKDAPSSSSHP